MIVIVPNKLAAEITRKLDAAFALCPDAEKDREFFRNQLLEYFDVNGHVPDFTLRKKKEGQ